MLRRLRSVAGNRGLSVGAKFANTLVVRNDPKLFPTQTAPYMYLSGPPLHVLSMNLMQLNTRGTAKEPHSRLASLHGKS